MKPILFFLSLMLLFSGFVFSQESELPEKAKSNYDKPFRSWSITAYGGIMIPYTDIRQYDYWRVTKPVSEYQLGLGLGVTKMLNSVFGIQGQFYYGKLQGVARHSPVWKENQQIWKQWGFEHPVYFNTPVYQGTANLYFNISNAIYSLNKAIRNDFFRTPPKARPLTFYGSVGLGLIYFDAQVYNARSGKPVYGYLKGNSGKTVERVIPLALGLKYRISNSFDVGIQADYIMTGTDKLDGLDLQAGSNAKPRQMSSNDRYAFANINFTYKFGTKKQSKNHLDWVKPVEAMMEELQRKENDSEKLAQLLKDSDGDGVPDLYDLEPNTPKGAIVDGSGRTLNLKELFEQEMKNEKDSDGDGIPDYRDAEPNSPSGSKVNFQGIAISDPVSTQPGKGGLGSNVRDYGLPSVYFDTDKWDIKPSQYYDIAFIARVLTNYPEIQVRLVGHADERGADSHNEELAMKRAKAVAEHLEANYNIPQSRVTIEGKGSYDPVSKIYEVNRRVEVIVR